MIDLSFCKFVQDVAAHRRRREVFKISQQQEKQFQEGSAIIELVRYHLPE
jgi:hypothetical protein